MVVVVVVVINSDKVIVDVVFINVGILDNVIFAVVLVFVAVVI